MTIPDGINGAFECLGGWFILLNIRTLWRDKQVKGIHWGSTCFFTSWGLWNLWYYPSLGQWASFAGGAFLCAANVVWLGLRIHFSHRCTFDTITPEYLGNCVYNYARRSYGYCIKCGKDRPGGVSARD